MSSLPQQRRKQKSPLVYCSIRHSGLTVTKLAAEALGFPFSSLPVDLPRARIVLGLHEQDLQEVWLSLHTGASVGRLFGADNATDKGTYEELGKLARTLGPYAFSECIPETWVLPQCTTSLQAAMAARSNEVFILKPRNSSEGNGIRLLLSFDDVGAAGEDAVVQRYVSRPMLLGGLKFDLRLYVLVKSLQPLEIWMCHEGLARFCTEEYEAPTRKNKHKVTSHLTNYSLNKRAVNFVHSDDPHGGNGSKRSLSSILPLIFQAIPGLDEDELWSRLSRATMKGMMPLVPFLLDAERQQRQTQGRKASNGPYFSQLFGVDVLLDENAQAWLLEVNSFPSLSLNSTVPFNGEGKCCRCMDDYKPHTHVQSAVDHHVKLAVLRGTLQILLDHRRSSPADTTQQDDLSYESRHSHFAQLMPDEEESHVQEALSCLAQAFGTCCKGGAIMAEPFRLRKLFVAAFGDDPRDVDLQLRRLAQQNAGLSFIPVASLFLERLSVQNGGHQLVHALLDVLQKVQAE